MTSKLFKYKKEGNNYTIKTKDSQDLVQQLRDEHKNLSKQINEFNQKKLCIEDKLRELNLNDKDDNFELVYQQTEQSNPEEESQNSEFKASLRNYSQFLPKNQQSEVKKRDLYGQFGYKEDLKQLYSDINNPINLKKLAQEFGLKSNNINKLKQQVIIIQNYLNNQDFPNQWQQIYNKDLFNQLQL